MASVTTSEGSCGGSLINDRFVLTATHCLMDKPPKDTVKVRLGVHRMSERNDQPVDGSEEVKVKDYILHPKFFAGDDGVVLNDIALIELETPVDLSKWKPICLPNFKEYPNLFVYGWGRQSTYTTGGFQPLVDARALFETHVDRISDFHCKFRYWGPLFSPNTQICAGTNTGSCSGDSGGPLSTRRVGWSTSGRVYQVGVVSFGVEECRRGKPDVYERVDSHYNFIEENTKEAKWCLGPDTPEFTKKNPWSAR